MREGPAVELVTLATMKDRLEELRKQSQQAAEDDVPEVVVDTSGSLVAFFTEVEAIRGQLDEIEATTTRLTGVHSAIHASAQNVAPLRAQAEDLARQVRATAVTTRKKLQGLRSRLPQSASAASLRMLKVQEVALGQRLQQALTALDAEQLRHRDRSRELLQAQLKVVRESLQDGAEDELQTLLALDQDQVSVFTDHIVVQTQEARQALRDIEERHHEIVTLERNIRDMRDLFVEISLHVEAQGELIDRIEDHVLQTTDHVTSGRKELVSAEIKQKSARKKKYMCIICIVVTLIVLIILSVIFYMFSP